MPNVLFRYSLSGPTFILKHLKSIFILSSSYFAMTMGLMVGCDSSKPAKNQAALNVSTPTDDHLKSVPNADFLNWSKFPEGTKVVRQRVLESEQGVATITTTIRLVARQPKSVEVESQTTVIRPQGTTENPPQSFTYAAEYKIPKDMDAEQFLLPDPKAKSLGAEKITMLGKEYDALVFKWQSMLESGPIDIKGWFSDDFPGRQIKTELDFKSDTSKGSETTLEVSIPEQK
jgi:hypothetical protein